MLRVWGEWCRAGQAFFLVVSSLGASSYAVLSIPAEPGSADEAQSLESQCLFLACLPPTDLCPVHEGRWPGRTRVASCPQERTVTGPAALLLFGLGWGARGVKQKGPALSSSLMRSESELDSDDAIFTWPDREKGKLLHGQNGSVPNGQTPLKARNPREEILVGIGSARVQSIARLVLLPPASEGSCSPSLCWSLHPKTLNQSRWYLNPETFSRNP
ncbi:hypothetical protein Celaphus_00002763 [Cervus elaphus hippelaphus]|uniref:Uncharacterized protein n=1 Tax=Cervus elaphus hippelaphus TaxID=46360 RepID=A0A212CFY2_CEREH|nr:hypothetical protein Celaphus_00002763 [Cervus elaphus hippelaphus]